MALKSTVFKAELQITDIDRSYYASHSITVARHPSETDERMMIRILAFALHASDALAFANGLTSMDEPDVWEKDLSGSIALWIMVGLPDEKQIKKACSRSQQVYIYCYGGTAADLWWSSIGPWDKLNNVTVLNVPLTASRALENLVQRSMKIQCTIQDGIIWMSTSDAMVEISPTILKKATAGR